MLQKKVLFSKLIECFRNLSATSYWPEFPPTHKTQINSHLSCVFSVALGSYFQTSPLHPLLLLSGSLTMSSTVQFKPLSGANSEDPPCYMLTVDGLNILLDCGWTTCFDTKVLEPLAAYA